MATITTVAAANAYLREHFIADYDTQFTRPPSDPASAFVALGAVDLDLILCLEEERTVGLDNVVVLEGVPLQLSKQPGRRTYARLRVTVRRHLDGTHSVWRGPHCLGRYEATGAPRAASTPRRPTHARAHRLKAPRRRPSPSLALASSTRLTRPRRGPRLPMGPRA